MRTGRKLLLVGLVASRGGLMSPLPAEAQTDSLGGYGAMAGASSAAMSGGGAGSGMAAPFGGRFGAVMPSSPTDGGVAFRPRPAAGMVAPRAMFTVAPMGGGIGGSGSGTARRSFSLSDLGAGGFSRAGMGGLPLSTAAGRAVMPPSFASPFRPPTSLPALGGPGAGMSM